jgi:hypothetical protein
MTSIMQEDADDDEKENEPKEIGEDTVKVIKPKSRLTTEQKGLDTMYDRITKPTPLLETMRITLERYTQTQQHIQER